LPEGCPGEAGEAELDETTSDADGAWPRAPGETDRTTVPTRTAIEDL